MDPWQYRPAADHGLEPTQRLRSLQREAGLAEHVAQSFWRLLTRCYLRIYHRLAIDGVEHLPKSGPFVMVANHASHLDAVTLAASLPWHLRESVFPIAAGDVFFEKPVVSMFAAFMLNALPMWRRSCGAHAIQELQDRLVHDSAIYILFPEGTRTRDGQIGRFKSGVGMIVGGSEVPVVPCYLRGALEAFPAWARCPAPKKLRLTIGKPLRFGEIENDREGWAQIARALEHAVRELGNDPGE